MFEVRCPVNELYLLPDGKIEADRDQAKGRTASFQGGSLSESENDT